MTTGSTSYTRESFVEGLHRMSVPQSKVAVQLRLNVLCWCTMAAAMTSCSSATLDIERFTSAFARMIYEHWSKVKIQTRSLELYYQNFKNLSIQLKANFLFASLNPNTNLQEKTPEICTFRGWCFKNKKHQKYLNVETGLLFSPALIKFMATRLVPLLVFTKRPFVFDLICVVIVFDLIYVVIISSSMLYLSKLTKFGLIVTIF